MTTIHAFVVAAAVAALSVSSLPSAAQGKGDDRPTPPDTAQQPAARRPGAPSDGTPPRAVPRPSQPPRAVPPPAVPRPPASGRPGPITESPSSIYPSYRIPDYDFVYRFPYGLYPYSRYGYPYPPYEYHLPYRPYVYESPSCPAEEIAVSGGVRIDIPQKDATVYADGYYVGVVEDFDGPVEQLSLTPGPHHIEVFAPRYEMLAFDVFLQAGRTITYRSALEPARP